MSHDGEESTLDPTGRHGLPTTDGGTGSPPGGRGEDTVYDRFEQSLQAGGYPRIEDVLGEVPEDERAELLGDLIALELTYRRRRGETPREQEYLTRFPGHEPAIRGAFAATPDPRIALHYGALALGLGLVSRADLESAIGEWVRAKRRPIGEVLLGRQAIRPDGASLLDRLVVDHLRLHDDDPLRGLTAIGLPPSVRAMLAAIDDPELRAAVSTLCVPEGERENGAHRFRIVDPVPREGGQGAVFRAVDEQFGRIVALKQVRPRFGSDATLEARLEREAKITGRLEHPAIVPAYARGRLDDGRPYYVMRFIDGPTLLDEIRAFHGDGGPRSPAERNRALRRLLGQFVAACRAIDYAHSRGVIHRDVKPHNVLLRDHYKFGETLVADWGLATLLDPEHEGDGGPEDVWSGEVTMPQAEGVVQGTPQYMAPEQAEGRATASSDVFGLGATLYHLLAGTAPYPPRADCPDAPGVMLERIRRADFPPPRRLNSRVPRVLEAICLRAMAAKPSDRYASVKELADDVESWLAGERVSAHDPISARFYRSVHRHRVLATAMVAGLLLVLTGGVFSLRLVDYSMLLDAYKALLSDYVRVSMKTMAKSNAPQARDLQGRMARLYADQADQLLHRMKEDPNLVLPVADVHHGAGALLRVARDLDGAQDQYSRGLSLVEQKRPAGPANETAILDIYKLVFMCDQAETSRMAGRSQEAGSLLDRAGKLLEVIRKSPVDPSTVAMYDANVCVYRGAFKADVDSRADAFEEYSRAVEILAGIHPKNPENWGQRSLAILGMAESSPGPEPPPGLEKEINEMIPELRNLDSPPNPSVDARFFLAEMLHQRARLESASIRHRDSCDADFREAITLLTDLAELAPWHEGYALALAAGLNDRADWRLDGGESRRADEDALTALSAVSTLLEGSEAEASTRRRARRETGRSLFNLARVAKARDDVSGARTWVTRAIAMLCEKGGEPLATDRERFAAYSSWSEQLGRPSVR
ncbi:serine/threonine-protein kinase [Aquisphaera insulae]|uniref:serine/threonine-protein kinase n=1 Tax=Aquisphaera insulae TaxID=2712864 RepID=UPI0013EB5DEE|nr:serine/threonine-protein kinase [Aquisphaera insulae]